jgi:ATP adenylyltransferase
MEPECLDAGADAVTYTGGMDRLWTPWRYNYITGAEKEQAGAGWRKGVPKALEGWPGDDTGCVFCNLIRAVEWGLGEGIPSAEEAGLVVARLETCYVCLNRFPYSSGHVLAVPYEHLDSLAKLPAAAAEELVRAAQRVETALRAVYRPDGINLGMNLGEAAGAGVAEHLHLHLLPRWFGDTNFMTVAAETRVLPETLETTWGRLRGALAGRGKGSISEPQASCQ